MRLSYKLLFSVFLSFAFVFAASNEAWGQAIIQDLSCPGCIEVPPEELDVYKDLFPLVIWTDYPVYDHSSEIFVWGYIRPNNLQIPITLTVTNPMGSIVTIEQIQPPASGDFFVTFNSASPLWKQDGQYIIKAQSGSESRVFKTKIILVSGSVGDRFECTSDEIGAPSDRGGLHCIPLPFKQDITGIKAFINTKTKTVEFDLKDTSFPTLTISIPRYILDARAESGLDSDYVILFDGAPASYSELKPSSPNHRDIQIQIPGDRDTGKLEIIGTSVVPEFGEIVILILVVSITSIVVISRKSNLIVPKF